MPTLSELGWHAQRQREFASHAAQGLLPGRVIGEHRTHYQVSTEIVEVSASLAGRLRKEAAQSSDLPGVGDFVALRVAPGDGPVIEAVLPRTSALVRKASGEKRPQLIAANVDVVFIVMALDGDFSLPRMERYLALVQASGAKPVIIANKIDTATNAKALIDQLAASAPGVPIHPMSAKVASDVVALRHYFDSSQTIALIGSSGVGKSTLTNQLLGRDAQRTQGVRGHDSRGRHTTTHRQIFVLPEGGAIMDTPGMRGLEVWTTEDSIEPDFADLEALSLQCRFRNCHHGSEPGCAIRRAIEQDGLDPTRAATFIARAAVARRSPW